MYRVDQRYVGQGLWNSAALPMTIQAATTRANALEKSKFADEVRIVPASSVGQAIDVRV